MRAVCLKIRLGRDLCSLWRLGCFEARGQSEHGVLTFSTAPQASYPSPAIASRLKKAQKATSRIKLNDKNDINALTTKYCHFWLVWGNKHEIFLLNPAHADSFSDQFF